MVAFKWGLDMPALAKYPKLAVQEVPKDWAVSTFSNTFGDSRPAVRALINAGITRIEVKLIWHDDHMTRNYSPKDFPAITAEAKKWKSMVAEFPHVEWYFAGECEHRFNAQDARRVCDIVLAVLPGVTCINNPVLHKAAYIIGPNIVDERHGPRAPKPRGRCVYSYDGVSCVDSNVTAVKQKMEGVETFFFWEPRFNLKWESDETTPRPQRKGKPDAHLIRSVVALAKDRGVVRLPGEWLYKSHSENHGKGDPRAEKPVVICPHKAKSVMLKKDGKLLHTFKYYGPYEGKTHRYYAQTYGYKIAQEPVEVWIGRKAYGTVNPAFRSGTFRD